MLGQSGLTAAKVNAQGAPPFPVRVRLGAAHHLCGCGFLGSQQRPLRVLCTSPRHAFTH
jgi:hypothetical protein